MLRSIVVKNPGSPLSALRWPLAALAIGILALALSTLFYTDLRANSELVFEYSSSTSGIVQAFFDMGRGVAESDSSRGDVRSTGTFVEVALPIPFGTLNGIRFDPLDRAGTMSVRNFILRRPGLADVAIPISSLSSVQQIASLSVSGEVAAIRTSPDATDPILSLSLPSPVAVSFPLDLNKRAPRFGIWFLSISIVVFMLSRGRHLVEIGRSKGLRITGPAAVWGAACVGTAIACFAVIFTGASFVAPGNGILDFYDACPTVPAQTSCRNEGVNGADVGAMAWSFLPAVVAEARAVTKDHEPPLWNRYNSAGTSLIGQGQFMLGDPLTWLQWLVGPDAWNFDAKFVVLRALFAGAIGLCVLTLTGSGRAAILVAFAAPFLGYFLYRIDHPAIFSLCYAPLISLAWLRLSLDGRRVAALSSLPLLMVANWLVLNSGTVKEAYMAMLVLNATGVIHFLLQGPATHKGHFWKIAGFIIVSGVCFCAAAAPVVGTFIATLGSSFTNYDAPDALQLPFWQPILLVDNYYYAIIGGTYFVSVNVVVAFGLSIAFSSPRILRQTGVAVYAACFLVVAAMVFGVVPKFVITAIPFIRNIIHIHNTFGTVLLVPGVLLAGVGLSELDKAISAGGTRVVIGRAQILLLALCALFATGFWIQNQNNSIFLVTGVIFLHIILGSLAALLMLYFFRARLAVLGVALLVAVMVPTLLKNAAIPPTIWSSPFFEPAPRASLVEVPAIVARLQSRLADAPGRVVGLGDTMVPGYNQALGLETISGPDALMVRRYHELMVALHMPYSNWGWRIVFNGKDIAQYSRQLDLLNVRYVLSSTPGSEGQTDTDGRVYVTERPKAWPRAFFSSGVEEISGLDSLANRILLGPSGPFAAVEPAVANTLGLPLSNGQIVPAANYTLKENWTEFTVDAPSAGVVVLTEANLPDQFFATVDGKPTASFEANHAFKAVAIAAPGRHVVRFTYSPRWWSIGLPLSMAAVAVWIALYWLWTQKLMKKGSTGPTRKTQQGAAAVQ